MLKDLSRKKFLPDQTFRLRQYLDYKDWFPCYALQRLEFRPRLNPSQILQYPISHSVQSIPLVVPRTLLKHEPLLDLFLIGTHVLLRHFLLYSYSVCRRRLKPPNQKVS